MKPWEEEWTVDSIPVGLDIERTRLAAAAPDMARVLLEIEWSCQERTDDDWIDTCPVCCSPSYVGHEPDCALDVALKKAGVR